MKRTLIEKLWDMLFKCAEVIERYTFHSLSRARHILSRARRIQSCVRHALLRVRNIIARLHARDKEKMKLDFDDYKRTYRSLTQKRYRRKRVRSKVFIDKKYLIPVFLSIIAFIAFGNILLSKLFFKPNVVITSIQYDIKYFEYGCHQVFTGYVDNIGKANAYDVEVFVTWVEMGGGAHTDSVYLGTIPPRGVHDFRIVFSVPDVILISYHTQRVTFSSMPS